MDVDVFYAINGLAGKWEWVDHAMVLVGSPKSYVIPGVLALAYWVWMNRWEALIGTPMAGGLVGIADCIGAQVKHLTARPRPCQILDNVHEVTACGGLFSFPSNHSVNTAVLASFFQVLYPKTGWVGWPIVVIVGVARVYVGGHYVTDVVGGWTIGGLIGVGAGLAILRWPRFRAKQWSGTNVKRHTAT